MENKPILNSGDYYNNFINKELSSTTKEALKYALDIRKFEIDLYWKRASYFWVLIGAALIAFFSIISSDSAHKNELSTVASCLGLVFSCAWLAVNQGSKFWQENWEKHVDMLENEHTGPLYKIVFDNRYKSFQPFSVSKVNFAVSLYVCGLWLTLCIASLFIIWSPEFIKGLMPLFVTTWAILSMLYIITCLFSSYCKSNINFKATSESSDNNKNAVLRPLPFNP